MKKKTDLLNPTPQQIKIRNKMWADALKKNKKKATGAMYKDGGRCCLAVAQNVAISCGVSIDVKDTDDEMPHPAVGEFFGWEAQDPRLLCPVEKKIMQFCAVDLNDESQFSANGSNGMSHKRIAECVMNTFVHPKKQKWTFSLKH